MHSSFALAATVAILGFPLIVNADCMGPYPPSMVKAFTESCTTSPKLAAFCGCMIDDVQKNIPLADFIEIGNTGGGIGKDPRFIKAGQKCMPLQSGSLPLSPNSGTVPSPTLAPTGAVPAGTPTAAPATTTVIKSPGVVFK